MTILGATSPPHFAIGESDYRDLRRSGMTYVDKTLWVADVLGHGAKVHVVPRPRRFGKTLNMSTLRYFVERTDEDRTDLFADTAIWNAENGRYREHFQRYPTIYLSFKDLKESTWEVLSTRLAALLARTFTDIVARVVESIRTTPQSTGKVPMYGAHSPLGSFTDSLADLTKWLHETTGQRTVVLIDDYDAPLHAAWQHGYWDEAVRFLGNFFSAGLKDNNRLHRAVLTGTFLINLTDHVGGFNNFVGNTILDSAMAGRFGFLDEEVASLCGAAHATELIPRVSAYCGGYRCGQVPVHNLHNPGLVIELLYSTWTATPGVGYEDNLASMLQRLLADLHPGVMRSVLSHSVDEDPYCLTMDGYVDLPAVFRSGEAALSFLLHLGLLTAFPLRHGTRGLEVTLRVPNRHAHAVLATPFRDGSSVGSVASAAG